MIDPVLGLAGFDPVELLPVFVAGCCGNLLTARMTMCGTMGFLSPELTGAVAGTQLVGVVWCLTCCPFCPFFPGDSQDF